MGIPRDSWLLVAVRLSCSSPLLAAPIPAARGCSYSRVSQRAHSACLLTRELLLCATGSICACAGLDNLMHTSDPSLWSLRIYYAQSPRRVGHGTHRGSHAHKVDNIGSSQLPWNPFAWQQCVTCSLSHPGCGFFVPGIFCECVWCPAESSTSREVDNINSSQLPWNPFACLQEAQGAA